MGTLKKYWPTIASILAGLAGALTPAVQKTAIAHPAYAALIFAAWSVLLHLLPSPVKPDVPKP